MPDRMTLVRELREKQEALRHQINKWVSERWHAGLPCEFEAAPMWNDCLAATQAYFDATTPEERSLDDIKTLEELALDRELDA